MILVCLSIQQLLLQRLVLYQGLDWIFVEVVMIIVGFLSVVAKIGSIKNQNEWSKKKKLLQNAEKH